MADALSNSASSVFTEYELPTARRIFTPAAFGQAIDISQRAALTRKALKNMLDTSDMISRVQQQKVLESELQYRGAMADANRANIPADIEARRLKSQTDLERMKMEQKILPYRLKTAEADARIAAAEAPVREAEAQYKLSNLEQQQETFKKAEDLRLQELKAKGLAIDDELKLRDLQPQIMADLDTVDIYDPDALPRLKAFEGLARDPKLQMALNTKYMAASFMAQQRERLVREVAGAFADSAQGPALVAKADEAIRTNPRAYSDALAEIPNYNAQTAQMTQRQRELDRQQRSADKEQDEEADAQKYLQKAGVPSGATEESILDTALQRMEENNVPLTDSDKAEFRRNPDAFAASRKPATRSSSSGSDTANQFNVAEYAGEIARQVAALRMLTGLKARRMREGKGPASAPSGVAPAPAKSESAAPPAPSPTSSTAMDPAQALLMRANARKSQ